MVDELEVVGLNVRVSAAELVGLVGFVGFVGLVGLDGLDAANEVGLDSIENPDEDEPDLAQSNELDVGETTELGHTNSLQLNSNVSRETTSKKLFIFIKFINQMINQMHIDLR